MNIQEYLTDSEIIFHILDRKWELASKEEIDEKRIKRKNQILKLMAEKLKELQDNSNLVHSISSKESQMVCQIR